MLRSRSRFWALAVLFFLLAAQVHVWLEARPARGHACQVCTSGVWAIVSPRLGLEGTQCTLRLEVEPPQAIAKNYRTEASAPRAPPVA
jgi:hypothetical protein